jgi:hypothetical protein
MSYECTKSPVIASIQGGKDYIFLLLFEQRQGAIGFIAVAVLMMLVNAHQAGFLPFFGKHTRVSGHGKNVGIVFTPFWIVVALLNWLAFG